MRNTTLTLSLALALSGCTSMGMPGAGPITGGGGAPLCTDLGYDADAQKVEAFLETGARFEANALALAADVEATCESIAADLGVEPPSAVDGQMQVEASCLAVRDEIALIVEDALPADASLTLEYEPSVCTVDVDAYAGCVAECDVSASADGAAQCSGEQVGGQCDGDLYAEADAQCQAACEARVDVVAVCTEPSLYVSWDAGVDPAAAARLELLAQTLERHYPHLLSLEARLEAVADSGSALVTSFEGASDAAGRLGLRAGACFADATLVAADSVMTIDVTLSVTVEVSASASASASAG